MREIWKKREGGIERGRDEGESQGCWERYGRGKRGREREDGRRDIERGRARGSKEGGGVREGMTIGNEGGREK